MKWVEIAFPCFRERSTALNDFLNSKGIKSEVEFIDCDPKQFPEILKGAKEKYDQIRVDSPFGEMIVSLQHTQSLVARQLKAADSLVHEKSEWWVRSSLYLAIGQMLTERNMAADLKSSVLVVGAGAAARTVVASLFRAGFKSFLITNKFDEQGHVFISDLKRHFFGVNFEYVPMERLVLLAGTNTLIVNTTPFVESNDLLKELYYFNFLKRDGMVWDLTLHPTDTPLLQEARNIGITGVPGYEVAALSDCIWVEWVTGQKISRSEYQEILKKKLETLPKPTWHTQQNGQQTEGSN